MSYKFSVVPVCPKKIIICLGFVGGFKSSMIFLFAMSTFIPSLHTTCPNSMQIGVAKIHFLMFKDSLICRHFESISQYYLWHDCMVYVII